MKTTNDKTENIY